MSLLRDEWMPLENFQPGGHNFENTCFIAVVANLRHILKPVMQSVRQYTWKDYINLVRTNWNGQYSYAFEHHGQHDAAELLGAILHQHAASFGIQMCVTRRVFCPCETCAGDYTTRLEYLPMIVLVLPDEERGYT